MIIIIIVIIIINGLFHLPAMRVNHQLPCGARAKGKIECQLIVTS